MKNNKKEIGKEIKTIIIVFVIVVAVFTIFTIITHIIAKPEPEKIVPATIQYKEIILGTEDQLKQTQYYLLIYREKDINVPVYEAALSVLPKEGVNKYYLANLDNSFNKAYQGEQQIEKKIKESSFSETTLLKIENNLIVSSFSGKESISNELKK